MLINKDNPVLSTPEIPVKHTVSVTSIEPTIPTIHTVSVAPIKPTIPTIHTVSVKPIAHTVSEKSVVHKVSVTPLELSQCSDSISLFTIKGRYNAKVVKVYDGDTIHIVMYYADAFNKFIIRLMNIDTDELKSLDETKKLLAIKARDMLSSLILNKIVVVDVDGFDKYGRLLAIIYYNGESINDKMIELQLGKEYHGGKKDVN